MVWSITSVDTMKDSRDTCYPLSSQMSAAAIAQGVNLCAGLNVTHITCDVFYDYPDYMALWVSAIRATGKNVWFRPHWNAWEGNNGVAATMTPAQYITATVAFIQAHPSYFQSGDILDMCSEADNSPYWVSTYGANYTNGAPNTATDAFNQYHLDLKSTCDNALNGVGITGVITGIHTLNSFWAKSIASFYPATVRTLGYCAMDSYPEGSNTTPSVCAAARLAELQTVANARPGAKIVIGELGYSNSVSVTDQNQVDVLTAEFASIATVSAIIGMNYWAAQGTETSGGHTHLFAGVRGAWSYRPAALTVRDFYAQQLYGAEIAASVSVNGIPINVMTSGAHLFVNSNSLVMDQAVGQRSTADFTIIDEAGTHHYEQGMPVIITDSVTGIRQFGGVITGAVETSPHADSPLLEHAISCADWHYLADKRRIAYSNANVAAGTIVQDFVTQVLASEGVTVQRGVNKFSAQQSDVEQNDMSGFSPGSSVTISQDTTPGNAWHGTGSLKVVTSGGANTFEQIEVHVDASLFTPGASVTISTYIKASTGTPTLRWFLQSNTGAIGGTTTATLSTAWQRITRTVTLPNPMTGIVYIGIRLDTGSPAQAITFFLDGMQIEQAAAVSAWELGGLTQSVQAGPTISEFTSNYEQVSTCIDALAQPGGFYWQIDANKVLWFVAPGTIPAPWALTAKDVLRGTSNLERTNPLYRNRQYVLGGTDQTLTQTETRQGDGTNTSFTMSYALAKAPTVTVNGVAQTVGIGGVDTGKQWYWNAGNNAVFQDSSGVPLDAVYQTLIATGATSGTFTLSYKGVATANINWNDSAATVQTRLQALSTVGSGNALVTGGPLPSSSLLITFASALAQDKTQVVVGTNALVGGTPTLATVSPLSVSYVGQFPVVVLSSNDAEVTAQLAREGGVGTGYVEDVVIDASLTTRAGAFQEAGGYIARYAQLGRHLTFTTRRGGLQQGQMLRVTLADYALSNAQMLIESVHVTYDGLYFWYSVSALLGPINTTWVQFFSALATQQTANISPINLGTGSTLTLLQTFTGTKTMSATFTPTVYTCPIIGPTTLCGPTRIVC